MHLKILVNLKASKPAAITRRDRNRCFLGKEQGQGISHSQTSTGHPRPSSDRSRRGGN
jgi:hypothetical protein